MEATAQKKAALMASSEYAAAVDSYSNKYKNGAGMMKPDSVGFLLFFLFSKYLKNGGIPPSASMAVTLAKEYGLNTNSARKALGIWSAYYGLRPPRTGAYSVGPRS